MRGLVTEEGWNEGFIKITFWGTNIGLFIMFAGTLLPVGILQVLDNIKYGFWHARSNAFWENDVIQILGQTRILPDFLIIIGSGALLLFMLKAVTKIKPVEIKSGEKF
jgi:nitric oxide reductase subunit B